MDPNPATTNGRRIPNVVVIMTDQMKATASHLWGSEICETPHLARLAADGVLYRHAFTPHPLCVPARVSLWSGRYPHSHGSRRNETLMRPGIDHAWRVWREAGFTTGLIGKNHCFEPRDFHLFDERVELGHVGSRGCQPPQGTEWFREAAGIEAANAVRADMPEVSPRFTWAVTDAPEEDCPTGLITGQATRFIREHAAEPFALWVSYPDPHEPYVAPRRYAEMFPAQDMPLPPSRPGEFDDAPRETQVLHAMLGVEDDDPDEVRAAIGIYHANVRFVDDGVGQILDALAEAGIADDTIVVFCADHGEFAGEHGMFSKGGAFYDCLVRVPLIVSAPGTARDVVEDGLVNLVDVVPTILRLQGLRPLELSQGEPLPGLVEGAVAREFAVSEYGCGGPPVLQSDVDALAPLVGYDALIGSLWAREAENRRKMVRTREWKYVHDPRGESTELYDLVADPWELENLAGRPGHDAVVADLRERLLDWSLRTEDGQPVPLPEPLRSLSVAALADGHEVLS